ncbi:hypothetical protein KGQ34_02490 [Patescibacteria group bacterium]|nr:hypothetical protein [Patescibacteria group bacterium]
MVKNTYPGKFIVLEGPEGGGKSTQAMLLARAMEAKGYSVCLTQEPTQDGIWGKLVRFMYKSTSLRDELPAELARFISGNEYRKMRELASGARRECFADFERIAEEIMLGHYGNVPMLMQLCFMFDRHDHRVRVEIPALGEGKLVISDRDFLSTLAYGASEGLGWKQLLAIHEEILEKDFVVPDLILLLDVSPEIGLARTAKKHESGKEYFDDLEKQKKIRAYFDIVQQPPVSDLRILTVDTSRDEESVHRGIMLFVDLFVDGFS